MESNYLKLQNKFENKDNNYKFYKLSIKIKNKLFKKENQLYNKYKNNIKKNV